MPDMKKIIEGLEHCKEGNTCYGCPYDNNSSECIFQLHENILTLLKEQTPIKEAFWDSLSEAELMEPMHHFKD